jgi:hypothetical protein
VLDDEVPGEVLGLLDDGGGGGGVGRGRLTKSMCRDGGH